MKVGDLVRPKAHQFKDQMGVVLAVGFFRMGDLRFCRSMLLSFGSKVAAVNKIVMINRII